MALEHFTDALGRQFAALDDLAGVAENAGTCLVADWELSVDAILNIVRGDRPFGFEVISESALNSSHWVHEVVSESGDFLVGRIGDRLSGAVPTALEPAIAQYYLELPPGVLPETSRLIFGHSEFFATSAARIYREAARKSGCVALAETTTSMRLDSRYGTSGERIERYIVQAFGNPRSKYGFLELYRALESAFLQSLLGEINTGFLSDPRKIIEKTKKALEKEREQLVLSLNSSGQSGRLNQIAALVDRVAVEGNSFANALKSKLQSDTSKPPEGIESQEWRGAWYVYQMRCAVAHAGVDGIVIEDFGDAACVIECVYPIMERMALQAIGVQVD